MHPAIVSLEYSQVSAAVSGLCVPWKEYRRIVRCAKKDQFLQASFHGVRNKEGKKTGKRPREEARPCSSSSSNVALVGKVKVKTKFEKKGFNKLRHLSAIIRGAR